MPGKLPGIVLSTAKRSFFHLFSVYMIFQFRLMKKSHSSKSLKNGLSMMKF